MSPEFIQVLCAVIAIYLEGGSSSWLEFESVSSPVTDL
jgi:hypothetical protein